MGNNKNAIVDLTKSLELKPNDEYPLANLGWAQLDSGDAEQAVITFTKYGELFPSYWRGPLNLGLAYRQLKKEKEAKEAFDKANPATLERMKELSDPIAVEALTKKCETADDFNMRSFLRRQRFDSEGSIVDANQVLHLEPASTRGHFRRAWAFTDLDLPYIAIAEWSAVIKVEPSAANYSSRSDIWFDLDKMEPALADANAAIEKEGSEYRYNHRGRIYQSLKKYEAALEDFQNASDLATDNKNNAIYIGNRSLAFFELGKYEDAFKAANLAIEKDPGNHFGWLYRGRANYKLGKYEAAKSDLDKGLSISPLLYYNLIRGYALLQMGKKVEGQADIDAYLKARPDMKGEVEEELKKIAAAKP